MSNSKSGDRAPGRRLSRAFLATALCGMAAVVTPWSAPAAWAQETTAQMGGRVVDAAGKAIADAVVTITHVPSGTVARASSNADGRFGASGLRVGGPYTVEIAKEGYDSASFGDVETLLGQAVALEAELRPSSIQEVVVASTREQDIQLGVSSQFSSRSIQEMPSVSRDIKSVIRLDPKVKIDATNQDAIEIAGTSPRFNSITVDGIRQSDDFGLNNNGYPTQRAPISLDAIEAVSVQTAPFDVQYGNFQGGTINVVTKSGTNDFKGSLFYYNFDDSMVGDKSKDRTLRFTFDEKTYGAAIGGPILKDKLFFFFAYDKLERTTPVETGPLGSGFPVEVRGVTQAEYGQVAQLMQSVYNFDVGEISAQFPEDDEKILAKLDWNITDGHRATLAYQRSEGNGIVDPNSSASNNRVSAPSNWYTRGFVLDSYSFQVFSDWTDSISTELKLGRKKVDAFQDSLKGTDFAEFEITTPTGGIVHVGPDRFRHANSGANDLDQLKLKADWRLGNHTLTGGYELESLDIFNLFVSESEGRYFFDCIVPSATCTNALSTRRARELRYNNHVSNDKLNGAARFSYDLQAFYIQDKWQISPRLTIQGGVRYEKYSMDDAPVLNPSFVARNGFENTKTYDGEELVLPRFGFNFLFDDNTTIYGGAGQFGGGSPNVWLANSFSNDGQTIVSTIVNAMSSTALQSVALDNVNGQTIPAAVQALLVPGNGTVNALDPDFEIPSQWRYSLGVNRKLDLGFLGENYRLNAEVIYSKVEDAVYWRDGRLVRTGTAPDGRPIYTGPAGGLNDLIIDMTPQGSAQILSLDLSKTWRTAAGRFDAFIGYAYNESEDVSPATSSTSFSNFGRVSRTDPNSPALATSNYETRHRFPFSVSWRKAFWGDYESRAALYVERRSGRPYSVTYGPATTIFGDPAQAAERAQLLFIPTNTSDIDFGTTTTSGVTRSLTAAQFDEFIEANGLGKYRGGFVPRNALRSPWVTTADLRLQQEIPGFFKDARGVISIDIENVANLVNNDWGRLAQVSFPHFAQAVDATIQPNGRYLYRPLAGVSGVNAPFYSISALPSVWRVQLGVRYEF